MSFSADVGGVINVLEPHPQFPYLAVSGLDHDIKLLMPVAEKPIDMKRHCKVSYMYMYIAMYI